MPPPILDERLEALLVAESRQGLQNFLDVVVIEASPRPQRFSLVKDDWQQTEILEPLVPAVEKAAGLYPDYQGPQWFQFYLPRGHAKTTVQALIVIWGLCFSKQFCGVTVAAADKDQAQEIIRSIKGILRCNPWLASRMSVDKYSAKGPTGDLEVISSDAASSYGKRRHIYIADEFTVWGDNQELFASLFSGADKIPEAVFVITSNAGYKNTWQEEVKENASADPKHWYVYEAPDHLASWMSIEVQIAKSAVLLPGEVRRVFHNQWVPLHEVGDFVNEIEVGACLALSKELGLCYQYRATIGVRYVGAIDYGPKRDRTVGVVMHRDEVTDLNYIDQMRIWQGCDFPVGVVPVAVVEEWIEDVHRNFHLRLLMIDPYQMESTIQKFEPILAVERFEARGGKANYEMAVLLQKTIVNRKLLWYEDAGLLRVGENRWETFGQELTSIQLRITPYGFRIDNITPGTHDDRATATGSCLVGLNNIPRQTDLVHHAVPRYKAERNLMGVPRRDISPQQRLQQALHRTGGPVRAPSAAERRGLSGRGRGQRGPEGPEGY